MYYTEIVLAIQYYLRILVKKFITFGTIYTSYKLVKNNIIKENISIKRYFPKICLKSNVFLFINELIILYETIKAYEHSNIYTIIFII